MKQSACVFTVFVSERLANILGANSHKRAGKSPPPTIPETYPSRPKSFLYSTRSKNLHANPNMSSHHSNPHSNSNSAGNERPLTTRDELQEQQAFVHRDPHAKSPRTRIEGIKCFNKIQFWRKDHNGMNAFIWSESAHSCALKHCKDMYREGGTFSPLFRLKNMSYDWLVAKR